jgi:hypothetical protein
MPPRYLFTVLAMAFLAIAILRMSRDRSFSIPARTWLTIALAFGLVSGCLWARG